MSTVVFEFRRYIRLISRKWGVWVFLLLDFAALATQLAYPSFRLPQAVFIALAIIGLLWAAFQVHFDIVRELPSPPRLLPLSYELLPLSFAITLDAQIPEVTVWFYAVNHEARQIELQSLDIVAIDPTGGPTIRNIPIASRYRVRPRSSTQVLCKRNLIDAETRAIRASQHTNPTNATVSAVCLAIVGRRIISFEIRSESLNGWVYGVGSQQQPAA